VRAFVALVAYSLKASVPPRRRLGLLVPCAAAILFGAIARTFGGDASHHFGEVAAAALFGLVLPVTTLVIGDAVLGAEIRRGSFTFTWLSPVPTWQVVVARWIGGSAIAAGSLALAFSISALVAGTPDSVGPVALGAAFGAMAYVAVFMAIGSIAQRAAVWSLAFVFLVERLLGAALSGIAQISPSWEARSVFTGMAEVAESMERSGVPDGGAAVVRLLMITALGLAVAAWRLPRLRMVGSSD
jgi:hypothetical protein